MVGNIDQVFSLWELLKQILHKYLNEQNGAYVEQSVDLILLFLESSILEDRTSAFLFSVKQLRETFIEIEQKILRYFYFPN